MMNPFCVLIVVMDPFLACLEERHDNSMVRDAPVRARTHKHVLPTVCMLKLVHFAISYSVTLPRLPPQECSSVVSR
eukprot:6176117-Pleurochrysis_carterae.AAC.6